MRYAICIIILVLAAITYVVINAVGDSGNCTVTQQSQGDGVVSVSDDCTVHQIP